MSKNRIFIISGLVVLTVALFAVGAFLVYQTQQNQAPTDSSAASCISSSKVCGNASGCYCGSKGHYTASCVKGACSSGCESITCTYIQGSNTSGSSSGSSSSGSSSSGSTGGSGGGGGTAPSNKCATGGGSCSGQTIGTTFGYKDSNGNQATCTCKVNGANNICGCLPNGGAGCSATDGSSCSSIGTSCSISTGSGTCVSASADGKSCKCQVQNMGGNKTCSSSDTSKCGSNQFCNGTTCQDKKGAGSTCTPGSGTTQCAGGTTCKDGVCSNPAGGIGCNGSDNNCAGNSFCCTSARVGTSSCSSSSIGQCASDLGNGSDCTVGSQCASNRCTGGKCVNATQSGAQLCTVDSECSSGYCEAGACAAKKGANANCTRDAMCSTGLCLSLKCRTAVDDSNPTASCLSGKWYCGASVGCSAPGTGKLCSNGVLTGGGSCTTSDACQAITGPTVTNGQSCTGLKQLSSGEPSNGAFVGCSGRLNCFCPKSATGGINTSGSVTCKEDVGNDSCGASSAQPVVLPSGGGTTTGGSTSTGGSSGGTTSTAPYCGDGLCTTNELCERTASGATTYKACTAANISGNTAPTGADVASCYNIYLNQPVTTNSCKYCGDGAYTPGSPPNGEQCDQTAPATGGNNPGSCGAPPSCYITTNACVGLTRNSSDTLRQGVGNTIVYTAVFQNALTTNPFPNIKLLVSSANTVATAVGRDANSTSSQLVSINPTGGYTYDAVTGRHTYRFTWEAANPAGVAVPAASYSVRTLTDGTDGSIVSSPTACTDNLIISAVVAESPNFSIVKNAAPVCAENGDAVINYSITLTNIGPVAGTPDHVRDTIDSRFVTLGINPTGINPAYGSYSAGVITWNGASIGSVAPDASVVFTYQIRIPYNSLIQFANNGPYNQVVVQFDTPSTNDNTSSFDVRTMIYCTIDGVPITGIEDTRFILFGLLFIVLGFVAYKYQLGKSITERFLGAAMGTAEEAAERLMPFEERIEKDLEKKSKKR
jgi:hypothetical protein